MTKWIFIPVLYFGLILSGGLLAQPFGLTKAQSVPLCLDSSAHVVVRGSQPYGALPFVSSNNIFESSRVFWDGLQGIFSLGSEDKSLSRTDVYGPIRLVPTDLNETLLQNQKEGLMYYKQGRSGIPGTFRCYTNGAWEDCNAGRQPPSSTFWSQSPTGNHIYNTNTGNVWLGTNNPVAKDTKVVVQGDKPVKIYDTKNKLMFEIGERKGTRGVPSLIWYDKDGNKAMSIGSQ